MKHMGSLDTARTTCPRQLGKIVLLTVSVLWGTVLSAQQLYFLMADRGIYDYIEAYPPVQSIAYTPDRDTILYVYRDYTKDLPHLPYRSYVNITAVEFYPKYDVFVLKPFGADFQTYVIYANNPDTIIRMPVRCSQNYSISPFLSMNIVNNHWAYSCTNADFDGTDYARFRGIDLSLSNHFDLSASNFANLHLTGVVGQAVYLIPNDGRMYLPIVSGIENRPPFSVELPQKYWVNRKLRTAIWVNDDHKTLVGIKRINPAQGEDYGRFYAALYNKGKDTWSDIVLKGNAPTIMAYGRYLAGVVQDKSFREDAMTGIERYLVSKISPGKVARDSVYMEYSFDEQAENDFYRPGILYLFNTENLKYIEWETGQGDSEILLVHDETVYYRVFNAIYKAPIVNGERLDKAELLVRDNTMVPWIHWAFFGKEIDTNKIR